MHLGIGRNAKMGRCGVLLPISGVMPPFRPEVRNARSRIAWECVKGNRNFLERYTLLVDKPMISIVAGLNVSFDKLQELMPSQLSLFNYVHDRGLVDLFVERYDGASAIDMSQENMTAFLSDRDEARLG
jgi:hypothetical protein